MSIGRARAVMALSSVLLCGPTPAITLSNERPAGEGVLCSLAIFVALDEIGRKCFPAQDAQFKTSLTKSIGKLDKYVLENSSMSSETLARFHAQMSESSRPKVSMCVGDGPEMYRQVRNQSAENTQREVDKLVSRPGKPSWGTCL